MAGASPAYFRALSSWAQCHVSWHNDSGQLGAGQWAVASKYLHIQPQNIQGMNFRRAFFFVFVYLSRSTAVEAAGAGRALRSQCKQIHFVKIYRQVKTKFEIYLVVIFQVVEVLSKHAGLWITTNNDVFYSQATHITFICPMRFDSFPLDTQVTVLNF